MRLISLMLIAGFLGGCDSDFEAGPSPVEVNLAPSITTPSDVTATVNSSAGPVSFSVSDDSTSASALVVSASTADTDLIADIVVSGDGAERTVEIVPRENESGTAVVRLAVSDAVGVTVSTEFSVSFDFEQADFASFTREIFAAPANAEPVSINAIEFSGSGDGDFQDLLDSP